MSSINKKLEQMAQDQTNGYPMLSGGMYPPPIDYSPRPGENVEQWMARTGAPVPPLVFEPKPSLLPTDKQARKDLPIATGVLDYFPRAIAYVAHVSKIGNDQHNPGEPLHWAKEKSTDHADTIARHLIERGRMDADGVRHSGKIAWRALALLEIELEEAEAQVPVASIPRHIAPCGTEPVRVADL
jgi:hypothetical protein